MTTSSPIGDSVIIANPMAQGGRVRRNREGLVRFLKQELGTSDIRFTDRPGAGKELAGRAIAEGARAILSLGGDGTHNEVVNGIMAGAETAGIPSSEVTLGILPAGTGGDFRRLLRGGESLEASVAALREPTVTPVDIGRLEFLDDHGEPASRYFLNIASIGIGGLVDRYVNQSRKRLGGRATFFLATARALIVFRAPTLRLVADGEELPPVRATSVLVCNGRFGGGGMMHAPKARLADGLFDVTVMRATSVLRSMSLSKKIYTGGHVETDLVDTFRCRRLEAVASTDEPVLLDIDGEAPGRIPTTMEVIPRAIRLFNPHASFL